MRRYEIRERRTKERASERTNEPSSAATIRARCDSIEAVDIQSAEEMCIQLLEISQVYSGNFTGSIAGDYRIPCCYQYETRAAS